ncbi:MAG: hypothetical protein E3J73_08430 [Candidatus Bathyarchaeum sp.]|nr:MAG: hypothetical protein E3J73_08430 [Candidatus Bathyarchaeum sp.]
MNDQTRLDRIIASIKAMIKKLIRKIKGEKQEKKISPKDLLGLQKQFEKALGAIKGLGKAFKRQKVPRKIKSATKNHNKKRNKVRAKMAVESNRINRIRVKRWKH